MMKRLLAKLSRKKTWVHIVLVLFLLIIVFVAASSLPKIERQEKTLIKLPSQTFHKDDGRAYFESTLADLGLVEGTIYGSVSISADKRYLLASAENTLTGAETFYFDFKKGVAKSVVRDYFFGVPAFSGRYIALPYNGLSLLDTDTGEKKLIAENSLVPERPMFSPNGAYLLYNTKDGPVLYAVSTEEVKHTSLLVGDRPLYWYKDSDRFIFSRDTDKETSSLFVYSLETDSVTQIALSFVGQPTQLRMDSDEEGGLLVSVEENLRHYTYLDLGKEEAREAGSEDVYAKGTADYFSGTIMKREDCYAILYKKTGETITSFTLPHIAGDTCPYVTLIGAREVLYEVRDKAGASRMYRYEDGKTESLLFERASTDPEFLFGLSADRTLIALSRGDHFVFYSL